MATGMFELIWLFFVFLPDKPFGQPAPAATVLRHVPPGAELVVALDVASLGQGMNQGLDRLLGARFVKSSPALGQAAAQVEQGREMLRAQTAELGIDPLRDIRYATLSVGGLQDPEPKLLAVFGGKIPAAVLERLAAQAGARREGELWVMPEQGGGFVLTRARDGTVLAGTREWVELALAGRARCPALKPLLSGYDRKTWALVALRTSPELRDGWAREADWAARPLLASFHGFALALRYQGWTLEVAGDQARLPVWRDLLEALGRLAIAGREVSDAALLAARALLGSLHPLAEHPHDLDPQTAEVLDALIVHRGELYKLAADLLVGPAPRPRVAVHKARASVRLEVAGKSAGLALVPVLAGAAFWARAVDPHPVGGPAAVIAPEEPAEPPLEQPEAP